MLVTGPMVSRSLMQTFRSIHPAPNSQDGFVKEATRRGTFVLLSRKKVWKHLGLTL